MSGKTYGEILREKGIGLGKGTTPTRSRTAPQQKPHYNGWERGIATDDRGMPFLDEKGNAIGNKRFSEEYRAKFAERDKRKAETHLTQE